MQLEAAEVGTAKERLRDKLGEETQAGARDRERGAAIEAAAEHGQPRERAALVVGEQPPRLVDGRSQAAMSFRHVPHRRSQEVDAALDLVRDLGAGEHRRPRGRELDTERHAVDEPADAERLRVPSVVEGEPGTTCAARSTNRCTAEALPFPFSASARPSTSNTHSLWPLSRS